MMRAGLFSLVAVVGLGLAGCPDNEFKASTWTKKLGGREHERAVKELEQLGDPAAIPALGKSYLALGKPVRDLQVIIALARPLTPAEAKKLFAVDFEKTGRPAHWDKASPFLQKALTDVDENNHGSVDGAVKAADALAEAKVADALPALIEISSKDPTPKLITAQVRALNAIGKYEAQKADAAAALVKLIEKEPQPPQPRAVPDDKKKAAEEKYKLYLAIQKYAIAALGELRVPGAQKTLIPALYRTPEVYADTRKALVALGPSVKDDLQKILRGQNEAVNQMFTLKKLDKYCGDKGDLPPDQCQNVSIKDFYAADVLGDFYDPATVPVLLEALKKPPAPIAFSDENPDPRTQYHAIFNALRKIGYAPSAPEALRAMWMGTAKKGEPAPDAMIRALAANAYAFVSKDNVGVDELGKIAADNTADDTLRQEAALAFARLSNNEKHIQILQDLSTKYYKASDEKKTALAGKLKTDKEAADKEYEAAKAATAAGVKKVTDNPASTAKQIQDAAKKGEDENKLAKKKYKEKIAPYTITQDAVKAYRNYARLFQTHIARIEIALRCNAEGDPTKCYANTLNVKVGDVVGYMKKHIKELELTAEKGGWSKDEQLQLQEGVIERGMLELGKRGSKASSYTKLLLDTIASEKAENRIIRQSILLALPKVAQVPCNECESKLDQALKSGEGNSSLGDLNTETLMLRHYFGWAGGKTPTPSGGGGGAAPAEKPSDTPPATPTEKAPEEKPTEKPADKPADKPATQKPPEKKPPAKPAKKGRR